MTKTADTRPAGAQFMQTFVIDQHEGSTREGSTVQDQAISKDTDLGGWQAKEESVVTSRRRRGPPAAERAGGTTPPHPSISCLAHPSCFHLLAALNTIHLVSGRFWPSSGLF